MVTLNLTKSEAKLVRGEMENFLEGRGEDEPIDRDARRVVEKLKPAGVSWDGQSHK